MGPSVLPPKVCRLTAAPLPRATTLLCPLTVTPSRPPPAMWRREVPLETGEQSCSKVGSSVTFQLCKTTAHCWQHPGEGGSLSA